jgi:type I restriction enzyme, S subunit
MSEWKEYKLSEYLVMNPSIPTIKNKKYSYIGMESLNPSYKYVEPTIERIANGLTKFQDEDTLFAKITPCLENGKIAQARNLVDNIGVGSTEFFVFRGKQNISDNDFVYYLLRSYSVKEYAVRNMTGSAGHQRVPSDVFDYLYIKLPNYDESVVIGKFLSSLDSKINLLRKQNQTLENIAQTLFKRWFVDFEFPDKDGKPYKSSGGKMIESELGEIPERCRVGLLGEILEFAYGKALKEENRVAGIYPVIGSNGIVGYHNEYFVEGSGIVTGRKGTLGEIIWINENFTPIDTTFYIKDKQNCTNLFFYYFLLKAQDFNRIASDSAVPGLNRNLAHANEICIPPIKIIEDFNKLCFPIFKKMCHNNEATHTFTKIRATLLPKLMSGQIRVKSV